jgi:hypothetical protein
MVSGWHGPPATARRAAIIVLDDVHRWKWVRALFGRVLGVVAVSVVLAGCSSSPAPTPSPSPRVFHATGDLCSRVDVSSLTAVLGPLSTTRPQPASSGGTVITQSCTFQFGAVPVEVSIQMATDGASVAQYYQGLRDVSAKQTQLSPVSGLGQDAYTYEDTTGPHLVSFDNNLYISYAVVMGGLPQSAVPASSAVVGAAVASAHSTMDKMVQ